MAQQEDDRMMQELARMAQVYFERGHFDMAQKMRALALEIEDRVHRQSGDNVIGMAQWSANHESEEKEA